MSISRPLNSKLCLNRYILIICSCSNSSLNLLQQNRLKSQRLTFANYSIKTSRLALKNFNPKVKKHNPQSLLLSSLFSVQTTTRTSKTSHSSNPRSLNNYRHKFCEHQTKITTKNSIDRRILATK